MGKLTVLAERQAVATTPPALDAWLAGIVMGLLATAILLANTVRDIETDAASGKETLVVKVGRSGGVAIYSAAVAGSYAVTVLAVASGWLPAWTLVSVATAPLAIPLLRTIRTEITGPPLIGVLKGTARLQLLVGVLISAGVLLDHAL